MKTKTATLILFATTSAFAAPVKVVTHIEYLEKLTGQMVTHHEVQNLTVERFSMDSFSLMKTRISFVMNESRKDGRPLMMGISNSNALLQGDQAPYINLPFTFFKKNIRKNHTYFCTQNYYLNDECRVQLGSAYLDLGVPSSTEDVCKFKVSTPHTLDFASTSNGPISDALAFPSIIDESAVNGLPFAISFECSNRITGQSLLKGYFLHNSAQAPLLD
jgi:hypothetical protein